MRCSGPTEQLLEISLGFSIVCLGFLVISVRSWWTAAVSRRQPIAEDLETSEETDALIPPGTSDVRWQHGKRAAATLLGVFSLFMFSLGLYDATVVDTNTSLNGELPPPQKYCTSNVLVVSFHVIQAVTWLLVAGVCSAPKAFRIVPGSFFSVRKILCLEFIDQSVMLVMVSLGLFVYDSSGKRVSFPCGCI